MSRRTCIVLRRAAHRVVFFLARWKNRCAWGVGWLLGAFISVPAMPYLVVSAIRRGKKNTGKGGHEQGGAQVIVAE